MAATGKVFLSATRAEARRNVIGLYRSWYREVACRTPHIKFTSHRCRSWSRPSRWTRRWRSAARASVCGLCAACHVLQVKELFLKNADVADVRVIDMLAVKVCAYAVPA